ncbi:MAG: hypothetical protein ACK5PG_06195 [Lysobacterales bacterium]|jgi:hypothetical protein
MFKTNKPAAILVGGNEYAFGPLTADRALALMTLWECVQDAGTNSLALATSKALACASRLCGAYGLPVGGMMLHELLSATRQIMEFAALQSAPYLSEKVIPEIKALQNTADQIAAGLAPKAD